MTGSDDQGSGEARCGLQYPKDADAESLDSDHVGGPWEIEYSCFGLQTDSLAKPASRLRRRAPWIAPNHPLTHEGTEEPHLLVDEMLSSTLEHVVDLTVLSARGVSAHLTVARMTEQT